MIENKNKPVFPIEHINDDGTREAYVNTGLTKREYFAAMAMQGILASYAGLISSPQMDKICNDAVRYADELLKKLSK